MALQDNRFGTSGERYTRVAVLLHWAIAAFIIFNLLTGFFMEGWKPPLRFIGLMLHVSTGFTVLLLTVVRIVWRLTHEPPAYPAGMKPWERHTAHLAHFVLYAAMVLMPVTGWGILSAHAPPGSAGERVEFSDPAKLPAAMRPAPSAPGASAGRPAGPPPPLKIWGVFPMPKISPIEAIGKEPGGVAPQRVLHDEFVDWHGVGGWLLVGLLLLHIAAALKHQFLDKQDEFARMRFGRKKSS